MMKNFKILIVLCITNLCFAQTSEEIVVNELINGSLLTTNSKNKTNIVIIIAGSGPTDRNGNQSGMVNNSLKFLAEGIVSDKTDVFNFDKRLFAQIKSGNFNEKNGSFNDMVVDVESIIKYFKDTKKYKNIIIAGHSEGSLIGMIAAKKDVAGFISIAGAGRSADLIIEEQIEKQAPYLLKEVQENFVKLKKGETFENKNAVLASLFRESVQPYIISWIQYNPQVEIKKLTIPTLILNGTKDIQVGVTDANLLKSGKSDSQIEIIENMNHALKIITGDVQENMASYTNPTLPVSATLLEKVNFFINKL